MPFSEFYTSNRTPVISYCRTFTFTSHGYRIGLAAKSGPHLPATDLKTRPHFCSHSHFFFMSSQVHPSLPHSIPGPDTTAELDQAQVSLTRKQNSPSSHHIMGRPENAGYPPHADGHLRAVSTTPQKTKGLPDLVDLTRTNPWARQSKTTKQVQPKNRVLSAANPTTLSPAITSKSVGSSGSAAWPAATISVPQDLRQSSDSIQRQSMAAANNANRRPSFFSRLHDIEDLDENGETDHESTPTPVGDEGNKTHKKVRTSIIHDPAEEAKRREKKEVVKAQMQLQTARVIKEMHTGKRNCYEPNRIGLRCR